MFINYKHNTYALAIDILKLAVDRFKCASAYISRL